ncbi:MAG TPA: asparagine synthase (glutamine-hydrolyzing) [Cytophagaceae bacterium]
MNKALRHRGPDASGWKEVRRKEKSVYLGNTRLKIIDLSDKANQPLVYKDRYYLSYNGEIYNYRELKQNLEAEFSFQSNSDSEVLLYHLVKHGIEGLNDLNGMFGFAFYDAYEDCLLIARDRFGIKPVYYFYSDGELIISSELRGIFASGLVEKSLRPEAIEEYLTYKFTLKPNTFYQSVYELEEGKVLTLDNDQLKIFSYLSNPPVNEKVDWSRHLLVERTESLLKESLQRQLRSDVPAGLFLSGGVDSTLLLALGCELGFNIPCFSICNSKEDKNFGTEDFLFAEKAATKYKAEFHPLPINESFLDSFPEFIQSIDQPVADGATMLTWGLSEHAGKHVKVILTGAGADELFAGYNRHYGFYQYLKYFHKSPLGSFIKLAGDLLPTANTSSFSKPARLIKKFARMERDPALTYLNFASLNTGLFEVKHDKNRFFPVYIQNQKQLLFRAGLQFDKSQYLISDILALTDGMAMQYSLETRVPFLDNDLDTFVSQIPAIKLIEHGQKWILKEILNKKGGNKEFTARKKEGFGMPLGKWWRTKQGRKILESLENKNNLIYTRISYKKLSNLLESHFNHKTDLSGELWALAVLTEWLEKEFN